MKQFKITCLTAILSIGLAYAQTGNKIIIHTNSIIKQVSPLMTGACIEDVNHEIYGGIYSQMVFGESFQELPMVINKDAGSKFSGLSGTLSCKAPRDQLKNEPEIRSWQPVKKGTASGVFSIDSLHPFVGKQSQQITFINGKGSIGIENRGLNRQGLSIAGQKLYEGTICVKAGKQTQLYLSLESEDGLITYAQTNLTIDNKNWKKYDFKLTPVKSANNVRLAITLHQPGTVSLGYVFLQPGSWGRYKNLPVRKDVVDGLIKQKLSVLRYGGSMINADGYRWKDMLGPRYKRKPYKGTWYPFSTNGWGIIDFLNLCEAAGFTAIPAFNSNETPADMADFIEYVNGGSNTLWGKKRIADGHREPYHLKYIELGNEQFNNDKLTNQFRLTADAIWSKDPNMQVIFCISDNTHEDARGDLENFKKTISHCKEKGHQAWFDVHIWNDKENEPNLADFEFAEKQFRSIAADKDFKLCVFEENANNARVKRALGHANAVNRLQRLNYDIPIVCAANCLQVDHQNDNGWDQGLLFLNQNRVWGQPSYYVTQMLAGNYLPEVIRTDFLTKGDSLDITSRKSDDSKTIILQVVNYKSKPVDALVILNNFKEQAKKVVITELKGNNLDEWNTVEKPYKIVPVKHQISISNNSYTYRFAPYSFTILRFEKY